VKVRYASVAADEIEEILAYLHNRAPQAAHGFTLRLQEIEQLLGQFPLTGTTTRYQWLRRIPLRDYPYVVFYEVVANEVMVLAVRHSARDPSSMPGSK
jgi:toxin ParE1/3/4